MNDSFLALDSLSWFIRCCFINVSIMLSLTLSLDKGQEFVGLKFVLISWQPVCFPSSPLLFLKYNSDFASLPPKVQAPQLEYNIF